jgi:predicted PurR-regulated permease PerM
MTHQPTSGPAYLQPAVLVRMTLTIGGVILLALLLWTLSDVLLLFFGAVVVAVMLRSLAGLIERHTPIQSPWSLALSGLVYAALIAGFVFLLGTRIAAEASSLTENLPRMVSALGERLGVDDLYDRLAEQVGNFFDRGGIAGDIAGYTSTFLGVAANVLLVVVAGLYLAAHPKRYSRGMLKLVPPDSRPRASDAVDNAGQALHLWLIGQLISMSIVGAMVTVGLLVIGMPSAIALGFMAGILEFVPIVGPILSAIPALLLALSEGGNTVFWVAGLYIVVQQVEGNLIMPLVQRRTVDLPPVLTLFALVAFGVLFGPLGILLGTPLAVVLYVAVKQLYLREVLDEPVALPGED